MSKLGPKVWIFVATIILQHCLNPLGHGVHQSFTGCHWSPLPLLHDDIMELVDVRDLALLHLPFEDAHRCSIGFRSGDMLGQSIIFTLSFFSKAVGRLGGVFGVVIMFEYSLRPSLCFSMSQYMLAFMVPSMNCSSPVPAALVQLQTTTLPHHAWL